MHGVALGDRVVEGGEDGQEARHDEARQRWGLEFEPSKSSLATTMKILLISSWRHTSS